MSPFPHFGRIVPAFKGTHYRCTPFRLDRNHPRSLASDEPHAFHLAKRLPHTDQPGSPTRRIDDDIGQLPIELLCQLIAHSLFALDAIGFL